METHFFFSTVKKNRIGSPRTGSDRIPCESLFATVFRYCETTGSSVTSPLRYNRSVIESTPVLPVELFNCDDFISSSTFLFVIIVIIITISTGYEIPFVDRARASSGVVNLGAQTEQRGERDETFN